MGKMIFATIFVLLSIGMSMNYLSGATLRNYLLMKNAYLAQGALNQLKQKMFFDSGFYLAPLGEDGANYHELPSSLYGSRLAAKGTPFMYCPYGQTLTVAADTEITDARGNSYSALKTVVSGDDYVRQSSEPPVAGLLAAIVLPRNGRPSCADIGLSDDGQWVLTGDSEGAGVVYAIHQDEMSYEGGQGLWLNAEDSSDLNAALSKAMSSTANHVVITLKPGQTFVVGGTYDFSGMPDGATLEIKSASTTAAFINGQFLLELRLPHLNLVLQDVHLSSSVFVESSFGSVKMNRVLSGPIALRNGELNSDSSSFSAGGIPAVQLAGSTWRLSGDVDVSSDDSPAVKVVDSVVVASGAQLTLSNALSQQGIELVSSAWKMTTGSISFPSTAAGGSAVYVDSGSSFEASNGSLSVQGSANTAFYIDGSFSMRSSELLSTATTALYAGKTAVLNLAAAKIGDGGSRAQVGIYNLGARMSGNVVVYANQCKSGDGFTQSIAVNFDDDTVAFANPDGTVVPSSSAESISVPLFEKINPIEITCL